MSAGQSPQRPQRPDWTIDQGWADYTAEEHAVWKTLFERQSALLPGRACDAFVDGMQKLPIGAEQIPDFRALSAVLMQTTGWQVVAVPGLVPDDVFFDHLATGGSRPATSSASPTSWTTWKSRTCSTTCLAMCPCS